MNHFRDAISMSCRLLLIAAVVLPSLVPDGYMVQRDAETDRVELTVCPGVHKPAASELAAGNRIAASLAATDSMSEGSNVHHQQSGVEICPFAVSGAALPEVPALLDLADHFAATLITGPASAAKSFIHPVPLSRGPPQLT